MDIGESLTMNWPIKRLRSLALALICLMTPFQSASALDPTKAPTQYVHSVWRTDEGLPVNSVTKILETSDGYLWVGTQAGLARFDGVRFTVFDHTNTPSLHDDYILGLVEDRAGTLWIATSNGGVSTFREGLFSHVSAIGARAGLALAAAADGSVWVGGYGGLTHIRNGKVIRVYTTDDGLSGDLVRDLVEANDKSVWIATPGGLNHLVGGMIESYSTKDGLPDNDVIRLHMGVDDTLWITTQNSGLTRRINGRFEPFQMKGVPGTTIRDLLEDRDGNIWFASTTDGLLRVSGEQLSRFTTKDGLSSNDVADLYEDRDGNLWVGSTAGGLDRFRDGSVTTYAKEEGLADDSTHAVMEDSAGDVWVTTDDGLNRLRGNQVRIFTTADGLPTNSTWSLWEDRGRQLWVGTETKGVIRMAHGRVAQVLSAREGIPSYLISGIMEDSAHRLWFSTRGGGLTRHANGQTKVYSRADGLLTNFLFVMAEGVDGTMWIGTSDGLNSIHKDHFKSYANVPALSHALVPTLYVDAKNTLWIGTTARGLFRLEKGRLTQYTTRQGLPDDSINSILEDAASNLWIGSNKGIFRISRPDLDAVAAGTSKTVQPILFGKADGMKSSETNYGTQPAGWRARDGRLWFPTIRGVVVVDPAHISLSDHQPSAQVEQMLADGVQVSLAAPVRLAPGARRLEIRYTAPSLSTPERTRFRYRLDGFDEKWVPGSTQRVAQYTNLAPGHYTFHISASAESGRWGARESTFAFELSPRFYQTWWFQLLYGLASVALLWGAYRLRVNWLHARAAVLEERQRIAGEIHDSLAQGLSGIIFQTEAALLSMKPGNASTRVTTARDLAKSSLDDARYSVWELSPPILDQKNLVESLSFMAQQFARGRVEELDIHSSGTEWIMRPEANHHVVLIAQEAISNAIQHGHARTIIIKLTYVANGLHLSVSDDGLGFTPNPDAQQRRRGYGMRNMHHRAERLGATLDVTSEVGRGTQIALFVPQLGRFTKLWQRLLGQGIARIDG